MENNQQFSLRWNNYLQHLSGALDSLRTNEDFVDVTLSCEGKKIKAHRMLLSACSNYFREIFKETQCSHPVIVFHNFKFEDLCGIIEFMYQGQVNIEQDCLESFLNTAELLEVQGLSNRTQEPSAPAKTEHDNEEPIRNSNDLIHCEGITSRTQYRETKEEAEEEEEEEVEEEEDQENKTAMVSGPRRERQRVREEGDTNAGVAPEESMHCDQTPSDQRPAPSNDWDSLQVFAHGLWRRLDPSLKRFNCEECGKVFKHPRSLDHHRKMHEGRTTCPVCHRVFGRMYALRLHITQSHPHFSN